MRMGEVFFITRGAIIGTGNAKVILLTGWSV